MLLIQNLTDDALQDMNLTLPDSSVISMEIYVSVASARLVH